MSPIPPTEFRRQLRPVTMTAVEARAWLDGLGRVRATAAVPEALDRLAVAFVRQAADGPVTPGLLLYAYTSAAGVEPGDVPIGST